MTADNPLMHAHQLQQNGFTSIHDVLNPAQCDHLLQQIRLGGDPGSRRLLAQPWCAALAQKLRSHPEVSAIIPASHTAVQCTYFEKSVSTNWLVTVHQDLSIPVESHVNHPALSGWSQKEGELYVQPPAEVLEELVAIRLHLDDCTEDDGPLRVVPGSHLKGKISPESAPSIRDSHGEVTCTLSRGTVLAMRPLLLHASSKAKGASKRRVLHFLFGPRSLPYGLQWQHAV